MSDEPFQPSGPVTGDAVELDVEPAGVLLRVGAFMIDLLITMLAAIAIVISMFGQADALTSTMVFALLIVALVSLTVLLPTVVETATGGRSVGKLALGLRVVRDDHGMITARHALTRALIGWVEIWTLAGGLAFFTAVLNPKAKRLGDMAAGTIVVRERVPLTWNPPVPMPPQLAAWAARADIGTLDPRLTLGARQYLMRRFSISPQARQRLSVQLAEGLRRQVAPQPPTSSPDDAIMAIVAERGRRDRARLQRHADLRRRLLSPTATDVTGPARPLPPHS